MEKFSQIKKCRGHAWLCQLLWFWCPCSPWESHYSTLAFESSLLLTSFFVTCKYTSNKEWIGDSREHSWLLCQCATLGRTNLLYTQVGFLVLHHAPKATRSELIYCVFLAYEYCQNDTCYNINRWSPRTIYRYAKDAFPGKVPPLVSGSVMTTILCYYTEESTLSLQ